MTSGATPPSIASARSLLIRGTAGIAVVAAILVLRLSPLRHLLSPSGFTDTHEYLEALGAPAPLAFVGLCLAGIGLGLPRLGFAALGGLSFGWLAGCVLAQIGTLGGCFVNFWWARHLGREILLRRGGRTWQGLIEQVARHPITTNVVLRLLPIGNSLALNSFLGVSPISSRDFLVGTALGTLPETLIFALMGAGVASGSSIPLGSGAVFFLALLAGTFVLGRRVRLSPEAP